jgi:creatinine amidohydrolase/Fe(II)-dependent formamide hydrolase-like protein
MIDEYLPSRVNSGPWVTAYTLDELRRVTDDVKFVLPICSLATPYAECERLGEFVLPPLYHEALDDQLKRAIVKRIAECFPTYGQDNSDRLRVVELPRLELPKPTPGRILAFSVDTAVEEHGPHLPLATDTIQSYGVLRQLAAEFAEIEMCRPVEYGQLTWGLPFGFSIDLTAELLTQYVTRYMDALTVWRMPRAIYVVDVHGSIIHRSAIVDGIGASQCPLWTFRWLYEPLTEFASERGDQHAGGVETAIVERIDAELVDSRWWPHRIEEIASGQMSFEGAVELTPDLPAFIQKVKEESFNGVIGNIRNYSSLDANVLFSRMMDVARNDIELLLAGKTSTTAGENLW